MYFQPLLLLLLQYKIYNSFKNLPQGWDIFVKHDVFLQSKYLQAIQNASPNNIQWFYIGIFKTKRLVGIAIVQNVNLYLKNIYREAPTSSIKTFFKDLISKVFKGNLLVVGNLTHTGQHGLYFDKKEILQIEFLNSIFYALNEIKKRIKTSQNIDIKGIMFKDYFKNDTIHEEKKNF